MKKLLALLLTFLLALSLFACGGSDVGIIGGADGPTEIIVSNQTDETTADTTLPEYDESHTGSSYEDTYADDGDAYLIDEEGWYYSAEDVALYLATYDGELPDNFITKNEARDLGWEGGSVEKYAPGCAIGGDKFQNREEVLPVIEGVIYYECDIDTNGTSSRGAERIVFSNDGWIYYTPDHYETFELLYEDAW